MKNTKMTELDMVQLDTVTGGTRMQEHALDVIFNGAHIWAEDPGFWEMLSASVNCEKRTGFTVRNGEINSDGEKELIYISPDGTVYSHDDFMDYLRANYTVEYLTGGKWTE